MAKKIQNRKSRAVCIVTDDNWQKLFVDKGVHKLYTIIEEFPDSDAKKKPFIPKEIMERKGGTGTGASGEGAVGEKVPSQQERRERVVGQTNKKQSGK